MRYYIIAGEASGDLHASNLMKGLYAKDPETVIRFRGGELMEMVWKDNECCRNNRQVPEEAVPAAERGGMAFDYKEGALMGLTDVIRKLGSILSGMRKCRKDIEGFRPDVVILVDYPGFNLRIARWGHRKGYRIFYYIAPKVWASREGRIKQIKRYVDRLFIVFPFEKQYFEKHGVPYTYCGNPLVDAVDENMSSLQDDDVFRNDNGIAPKGRIVALLAGSRKAEVSVMMPLLREVIGIMSRNERYRDLQYVIAGAPGRKVDDYGTISGSDDRDGTAHVIDMGEKHRATLVFGQTRQLLAHSHCAIINSGTASLEAALIGTPQVVVYKFASKLTTAVAKHLLKVKYISLGNLCLDRLVFKEIYRPGFTAEEIAAELAALVDDEKYRDEMKNGYTEIRDSLGGAGASNAVAGAMIDLLDNYIRPRK